MAVDRTVSNVLEIMRIASGRRNGNDPDSSDETFLRYLNDFLLTMDNDVRLFEMFDTLVFDIDGNKIPNDGVYTFNDLPSQTKYFVNIVTEAFISLLDPVNNSISWNYLSIYQNPIEFYSIWGINNYEILTPGYPTDVLFYGNEIVFRTVPQPDVTYRINMYGYKANTQFQSIEANQDIPYGYWLRYLAYGALSNYVRDYRYDPQIKGQVLTDFAHERKLLLTRTHNQIVGQRCLPKF